MKPSFSWEGSAQHEFGIATFTIGEQKIRIGFASFTTANMVAKALEDAYQLGRHDCVKDVKADLDRAWETAGKR